MNSVSAFIEEVTGSSCCPRHDAEDFIEYLEEVDLNVLTSIIDKLKGKTMAEPAQSEAEAAVREHLFALQTALTALDQAHETACKVLEKIRGPLPAEVPDIALGVTEASVEPVSDLAAIDVPWTADPGSVLLGEQLTPEPAVAQGVRYAGADPDMNSGHTAVIRYE